MQKPIEYNTILEELRLAHEPRDLADRYIMDIEQLAIEQALFGVLMEIDQKRADTLATLLEQSSLMPDDTEKELAVWRYVRDAIPEFVPLLRTRATYLYTSAREEAERYEAGQ